MHSGKLYCFQVILLLILSLGIPVQGQTYSFEFTTTGDNVVSISNFSDKVILLDWAASWCSICKQNQQNMNDLYQQYKDRVNFLTISYGGSNDDIDDVSSMKGQFQWTFGLDHENVAADYGVSNGYVWILNENLELKREWEYTVVSTSDMKASLDQLLDSGTINEDEISNNEVQSFGIQNNPIFLILMGFIVILILIPILSNSDKEAETKKEEKNNLLDEKLIENEKNWEWNKEG